MTYPDQYPGPVNKRKGFPFFLWVLIFGLLARAGMSGLRLEGSISQWEWLNTLGVKPGPLYIAVTGGVFALIFLVGVVGILTRQHWARHWVQGIAVIYALWFWIDRLVIAQSRTGFPGWFMAAATVVLLGFTFAALEASRSLFEER